MRNITNIPAPRVAFIDERTGLMSREWYRFFLNLFVLTGSGNSDVTIEDLQKSPIADVVVPVVDVLPATSVVVDNTETQLAVLSAKYDEISDRLEDLQLSVPPAGSGGSVTKVSVVTANGLAGTVANSTTTPEITLSTTETGILTGNGTSISNAVIGTGLQYSSSTLSINATTGTEILRGNGSGQFSNITVGTGLQYASSTLSIKGLTGGTAIQYENGVAGFAPVTIGSGLSFVGGTLSNTSPGVGTVTNVSVVSANGLAGTVSDPTTTPSITLSTTQTGVLTGNGTSINTAVIGTGLQYSSSTLSIKGLTATLDTILASDGASGVKSISIGTGLSYASGILSNTANGTVTSVTATAPVASTGGTTPVISMSAASALADGYLTSTDWSTFNNKQPAGSYLVSGGALGTPSSGTLTNVTGLPLSTGVTGLLPITNGGTGTATPALVAGTNVSITGSWPNQTINASSTGGTVTSVSVVSANGLAGTVSNPTTTPAITLSTTQTGILTGNGTSISNAIIGTGLQYSAGTLSSTINGTFQGVYNASVGSAFATMMTTGDGNKPFYVVGPTTITANVGSLGQNFQQINYMNGASSTGGAGIYSLVNCSSYGFINPMLNYDYAAVVGVAARGTTGTVNNSLLGGLFQTWINSFVGGTQVTATELDCSNEGGYGGLGRAYPECGIGAYINTASTYSPFAGIHITKIGGAGWYNGILLNDVTNHAISVGTSAQSVANTPVFDVTAAGVVEWGSGSATPDTKLYRQSAGVLRSNQNLQVNGNLDLSISTSGTIDFPSAAITTGASTGTYVGTNKPGSSSSNVWLVVKVNGTNYYLPAWT